MPKVWEAIGSEKPFKYLGEHIYRGDATNHCLQWWNGESWEKYHQLAAGNLFEDCTYVPDPSLVDFATAYEAAKAGKKIEREHRKGNKIVFRYGRLVELGCGGYPPLYITDDIIYGKFRILGDTE